MRLALAVATLLPLLLLALLVSNLRADAARAVAVPTTDGAMAVDCDAGQPGVQDTCAYSQGAEFEVQVHIVAAPAAGHFGLQAKLRWPDGTLNYQPAASAADEKVWAGCTIPTRNINEPADPSLVYGCLPFPLPIEGITETGAILQFAFQCDAAASAPSGPNLLLVPRAGDAQFGAHFLDQFFSPIDPALTPATVDCSAPVPPDPDPDGDGCLSTLELGIDPLFGGGRDPNNFWDFFDTPDDANARDQAVASGDLARVVQRFGSSDSGAGNFDRTSDPLSGPDQPVAPPGARANYHPAFDRSPDPPDLSGPADGVIATGDIALIVAQFGHSCA
ncbi:MAG: flexitail domain-containing putative surface protein [Dehalococcoidia bacterium]